MDLRIGLDGTPLLGQRSGVGNYTGRLLAALIRENPEWEFLLYSNRPLEKLEPALRRVTPVYSRFSSRRLFWMHCLLPATIRRSRPQLCHFPNSMAPLWQKSPFVLTIHDASLFLYGRYHPPARLLSIRFALPLLARRAEAIITVSHSARDDLIRTLQLPPEKVHVIYEAAASSFRPVTDRACLDALRRKYDLPEEFLLFVGTLEPRKNLRRLVRALQRIRREGYQQPLVLVGADGWKLADLHAEIERLGLKNAVRFTGYVPAEELPGLFSLATLFVFPSLYEGFGLPPLEAMACGTPVLTSNSTSLAEIYGGGAYLVNPRDEEELAAALMELLDDEELRRHLGQRGRRHAQQFSWARAARKTAAVYRHVLNGSPVAEKMESAAT